MEKKLDESKRKARDTYDSAADYFDHRALSFWSKYGASTVSRLNLNRGSEVLDVGCGSGASAIPAAHAVGPEGRVIAVDLAENLLDLGRQKAQKLNLNIEFVKDDMSALDYADNSFDAVVSVFSIFFISDMERQVRELWRMAKPGGTLAVTTWGPDFFEPVYGKWKEILEEIRPDLHSEFNPWDRISDTESLSKLMLDAGTTNAQVEAEAGKHSLNSPEDWWTIALGSGLRWVIDQLTEDELLMVKQENLRWIEDNNIDLIGTNVLYATAKKDVL